MGLSDITGVFSRYFVVGFFLPAYVSLVSLWLSASSDFIPNAVGRHSEGTELLILGGIALVAGLVLSGSSYLITRAFEGYPLMRVRNWPVVGLIADAAIAIQRRSYDRLRAVRDDRSGAPTDRARAAWTLDRFFPHDRDALLPTRMGNVIRAFEQHSNVRWGLDGVTIWPWIDTLLSGDERELQVDAKIDLYVFINAALGAFVVGVCLVVDKAVNVPHPASYWPLYAIPFVVGYILYRAALAPAAGWGDAVRAAIDLHRLELYEKLGVRTPLSFSDERRMAERINKAILYGNPPLSDDLWRRDEIEAEEPAVGGGGGLLSCVRKGLKRGE
jgi:hypothetical protein